MLHSLAGQLGLIGKSSPVNFLGVASVCGQQALRLSWYGNISSNTSKELIFQNFENMID